MTYTLHPRLLDPEPWLVQETDKMISEHQMRGEVDSIAPPSVFAESVQHGHNNTTRLMSGPLASC